MTEVGRLATRGLSGCVGLAVSWEAGPNTWDGPDGHRAKLDHALAMTQATISDATEQKYRYGIPVFSEPEPTRTVKLLAGWLKENGINSAQYAKCCGCDVSAGLDEDDEMTVSEPKPLTNYLIAPTKKRPNVGSRRTDDRVRILVDAGARGRSPDAHVVIASRWPLRIPHRHG